MLGKRPLMKQCTALAVEQAGGQLHNHSLPADVGYCSFQAPLVRCPLPLTSVDTQSCASCKSSSVSTHPALSDYADKASGFNVIHAKRADLGLCGHI